MTFHDDLMAKARKIRDDAAKKRAWELREFKTHVDSRLPDPQNSTEALSASYEWIPMAFAPFSRPYPANFDPMIQSLEDCRIHLDKTAVSKMTDVKIAVQSWRGLAADEYDENFLSPFPKIVDHQYTLAGVLKVALEANKEIFMRRRRDIVNIANATITAIRAVGPSGGEMLEPGLSVTSAVTGVSAAAAGLVPGGAALSIVFAVVSAGASLAKDQLPDMKGSDVVPVGPGQKPVTIGGDTVDEVLSSMSSAMLTLEDTRDEQEHQIVQSLKKNLDNISAHEREIVAPAVNLIGSSEADTRNRFAPPN